LFYAIATLDFLSMELADEIREEALLPPTIAGASSTLVLALSHYFADKCVPVIGIASLALVVQASSDCDDINKRGGDCGSEASGHIAYAIAVGVVSLILTLSWLYGLQTYPRLQMPVSLFLALWWSLAAGLLTFDEPYTDCGNAYFATWIGTIFSNIFAYQSSVQYQSYASSLMSQLEHQPCFIILLASIVELACAADNCDNDNGRNCKGEDQFAVWVGCLSIITCLVPVIAAFKLPNGLSPDAFKIIAAVLFAIWIPGVYVLTFRNPFRDLGNAYFATWFAALFSVNFAHSIWFPNTYHEQKDPYADDQSPLASADVGDDILPTGVGGSAGQGAGGEEYEGYDSGYGEGQQGAIAGKPKEFSNI
jgi:hypothetical protein